MTAQRDPRKTAPIIRDGGQALFGERWPQPLAHALRRKTVEVWDWAEGLRGVPMEALLDLRALLMKRWDEPQADAVRAVVGAIDELL